MTETCLPMVTMVHGEKENMRRGRDRGSREMKMNRRVRGTQTSFSLETYL